MRQTARLPAADPLYLAPPPERPHYATGMLLDAGDFRDEQTYHRGRLAQAVAFLSGGGTLAGLRVSHVPAQDDRAEEIEVGAGVAIDRIGRLVELPRPACLRLQRWWDGHAAGDGDPLRQAAHEDVADFLSGRAVAEAGTDGRPPVPDRAVIADVFVRFVACPRGFTPSFASGPFDALDAVVTSRLRDAYELLLVPRPDLVSGSGSLPDRGPDLAAIADPDERAAAMQDAVLDAWPTRGHGSAPDELPPLQEHPLGMDPTAQFLARIAIPVDPANPPGRDGDAVLVDNAARRFVPSTQVLQRWIGI
jgi:hypothetical protein